MENTYAKLLIWLDSNLCNNLRDSKLNFFYPTFVSVFNLLVIRYENNLTRPILFDDFIFKYFHNTTPKERTENVLVRKNCL